MDPTTVTTGVLLVPAIVAAVALLLLARPRPAVAAGIAVALGAVAGWIVIAGVPPLAPVDRTKWIPHVAAAAAIAAVLSAGDGAVARRIFVRAAAAVFVAWAVVLDRNAAWVGGAAAAILVLAESMDRGARSDTALAFPITLALTMAGTAACVMLAGAAVVAFASGAVAVAAATCAALSRVRPASSRSLAPVGAALLVAILLCGALLAELPWSAAGFLAAAPLSPLVPAAWLGGRDRARTVKATRIALTAICAGAALVLTHAAVTPAAD